ncbi:MAG TPA: nucleoside phosphorylase [Terriglobales bacterium]|nr:nucleoside phosphorylase [Terriglobales bacterium]
MDKLPLLNHPLDEPSAFTPQSLLDSVRRARCIPDGAVPPICILEFDGDITDWLIGHGLARKFPSWPCFHTTMFALEVEDLLCGIVPRTIGGPYAVLIGEQLAACGAKLIVGLTSAGRIAWDLPLPCLVAITGAIRDEGTSFHYLPASREVTCPSPHVIAPLAEELSGTGWSVRGGKVWTTDAPYRETQAQLRQWGSDAILAVEMQAASLFAFGRARGVPVVCVAMVSNAVDHDGEQFNTGSQHDGLCIIKACARAFKRTLSEHGPVSSEHSSISG